MVKIFRNYDTLSQFNSESVHPENKICFIKDKGVIYSNGVQYSHSKMHIILDIGDSDSIVDKFNELRIGLLKSNLMAARTPNTVIYWTGNSNTISISGGTYKAEPDKINIDGVEYYQLKLDKDLNNNFYNFNKNTFTNLIFKDIDTSKVTNFGWMFSFCGALTSLDVLKFDTSNVTTMNGMFYNCSALTFLDVSKFDTSNVNYIDRMFYGCWALTSLDVSKWDTSNVTTMNSMFYNCSALTSLDLSGWNTSKVTNMYNMFYDCRSLTSLDISGWNISNVTNMSNMFYGCSNLSDTLTIRMVGCSQTTIDKIKAQLSTDGVIGCTIVTE